jgi:hypothetical protein
MKKEYIYPSMEVLELGTMSQLMTGTVTNVESNADINPVIDGGHEQPRAKESAIWSSDWE